MGKENATPLRGTVQVNAEAKPLLEQLADELGVGKNDLVSRMTMWLHKQPRSVQREMIEKNGDVAGELVRLRQASGKSEPLTVDEGLRQIRAIADQCATIYDRAIKPALAAAAAAENKSDTSRK